MAPDQAAITKTAVETARAAVQGMAVAMDEGSSGARSEPINIGPKLGRPILKEATFDWAQHTSIMSSKSSD